MAKRKVKLKKADLVDLPDEVRELIEPHVINPSLLESISVALTGKRDEARTARKSSMIESIWMAAEEAYAGIDDANRAEWMSSKWTKPLSIDGPLTSGRAQNSESNNSTVFVRITSRYVDAGSAKLSEILLPIDDKAFSIEELPEPELLAAQGDQSQVVHDGMGNVPLTRSAMPHEAMRLPPSPTPLPGGPAQPSMGDVVAGRVQPGAPKVPLTVADLANEKISQAHKSAKAAEKRIDDWLRRSLYNAESRKSIFDSARIGTGILKGPFPKSYRGMAVKKDQTGGINVVVEDKIRPAARWVSPWNIFPDPCCGESIHDGEYVFERDYLVGKQVEELKRDPSYIASQIDKVIYLGPGRHASKQDDIPPKPGTPPKDTRYEVWYYYGTLTNDEMACVCDAAGKDYKKRGTDTVFVIVTLINDIVIKAAINPLNSGSFPYHAMPWQRRNGHWAGIGIAEQIHAPQSMINAATRAMLDNAGIAAGPQVVIDMDCIDPADGVWNITPNKLWYKKRGSANTANGVKDAFATFELPSTTDGLMKIIEYALKLAEESTSIPLVTQGQSGKTTPETYGATSLQDTNANQLLRSIGYAYDDYVTEPMVNQFYEWLLLDPDVPDEEKGSFKIEAHGSAALVERAIQDQAIGQMGTIVKDPDYGLNPKLWAKMMLKSKRIHPDDMAYTKEELDRIAAMPPAEPPAVTAAKIKAGVDREKIAAGQSAADRNRANEAQIFAAAQALDGKKVDAEERRTLSEATIALHELQHRYQLAIMQHAAKHNLKISDIQAQLEKESMRLDTAERMNAADRHDDMRQQMAGHTVDLHKHAVDKAVDLHKHLNPMPPATQTPGRAGNGRSAEQGP